MNVIVANTNHWPGLSMHRHLEELFPSKGAQPMGGTPYRKLVLHMQVDQLKYAQARADERLRCEMASGYEAIEKATESNDGTRSIIAAVKGGPYGSEAIPKLQTDARAAWRDVLTDRDGTFESWYKCTIEVHPQKRSNGPWMISAPADLRAAMPRKVAARLSEGERYDFEYEPPSDWCEIDELEGWEKWHLIWNKNFREWWQAALTHPPGSHPSYPLPYATAAPHPLPLPRPPPTRRSQGRRARIWRTVQPSSAASSQRGGRALSRSREDCLGVWRRRRRRWRAHLKRRRARRWSIRS